MKRLFQAAALILPLFMATTAFAATALVTTTLHLRTGPSSGYPVITSMPDGAVVHVSGCVRGYSWCRVDWNGNRGWASASYLAFRSGRYRHRAFSRYGARIGVPLIAGAVIGNAFHGHRHYRHHRRHDRHVIRHRRRHDRHGGNRDRHHGSHARHHNGHNQHHGHHRRRRIEHHGRRHGHDNRHGHHDDHGRHHRRHHN